MRTGPARRQDAPFFTAPGFLVWFVGLIVLAHLVRILLPDGLNMQALYWFALWPDRFHAMLDGGASAVSYTPLTFLAACIGYIFVHADWMHVLLNCGMLLALGAPVARRHGARKFFLIFFAAALAGALVFFLVRGADGPPAIGASGGVCGILAGAFLLMAGPRAGWPELVSRSFLQSSAAFLLINIALIFFGPSLFGAAIAWDTHIGGCITGALVMAALASTRW